MGECLGGDFTEEDEEVAEVAREELGKGTSRDDRRAEFAVVVGNEYEESKDALFSSSGSVLISGGWKVPFMSDLQSWL